MTGEWQPIATAPRDGTAILIWQPVTKGTNPGHGYDDGRYAIGYWRMDDKAKFGRGSWGNRNDAYPKPTHWMPLPPPLDGNDCKACRGVGKVWVWENEWLAHVEPCRDCRAPTPKHDAATRRGGSGSLPATVQKKGSDEGGG